MLLGTGSFSRDLERALKQKGFNVIGSTTSNNLQYNNNESIQLLIAVFNRQVAFSKLVQDAMAANYTNILLPWDYYAQVQEAMGWRYWLADPNIILDNQGKINDTMNILSDDISIQRLKDICSFRTGNNLQYAHYVDTDKQYFNQLTLSDYVECYVDGGAYNADTYKELCSLTHVYSAVLFEPDVKNFKELTTNASTSSTAICLPLALSDKTKYVKFNSNLGESANISDQGTETILTVSLDQCLQNIAIDFIKFDLEGSEYDAIIGAENIIQKCRPKLALSLYHKPEDLWRLPLLLKNICTDYNFYIRQHYFNSFDCVLYAIPK